MTKSTHGGFSLQTEEIVATLAVFALTGFFIWQQLFRGDDTVEEKAGGAPAVVAASPADRDPAAAEGADPTEGRQPVPARPSTAVAAGLVSSPRLSCEPTASRPVVAGAAATTTAALDCGISVPPLSPEERAQGVDVGEADEVVLGGEIELVEASYSATSAASGDVDATPSSAAGQRAAAPPSLVAQSPDTSSLAVTAVDIDQSGHRIRVSGIAPEDRRQVQLVVNGRLMPPVPRSASGRWEVVVPASGDVLHLQLRGLDAAGRLVIEPGALESAYVISLRNGGGDADITVVPGLFHRALDGEDAASIVSDFQIDRQRFDELNALNGRAVRPGQWVFVPLVAANP